MQTPTMNATKLPKQSKLNESAVLELLALLKQAQNIDSGEAIINQIIKSKPELFKYCFTSQEAVSRLIVELPKEDIVLLVLKYC